MRALPFALTVMLTLGAATAHAEDHADAPPPPSGPNPAAPNPAAKDDADKKSPPSYTLDVPRRTLPPWVFWGALGTTAAVGALTAVFYANTASLHDDFVKDRSNESIAADGSTAQIRTRFLITSTAILGIATAVLGLVAVKWSDEPNAANASTSSAAR
jgi:hypothetical protein